MIKSELVQRIASQNPHLYQRDVENIVNAILGEITAAMSKGDRVELRGFGAFSVKHRPARTGRNPRTGAHVSVEQKSVPFFKTGKEMRERLNKDGAADRRAAELGARFVVTPPSSWPGIAVEERRPKGRLRPGHLRLWNHRISSERMAGARRPSREPLPMLRKILSAVILVPLLVIFVAFAVANRQTVTVSFDPFSSTAQPAYAVTLPLFVDHVRAADRRRDRRRHGRLACVNAGSARARASSTPKCAALHGEIDAMRRQAVARRPPARSEREPTPPLISPPVR